MLRTKSLFKITKDKMINIMMLRTKSLFKITKNKTINIMMLHNGRCGSTVVGNLLAQNPNMHWASELYTPIIEKWKERNQQEYDLAKEPIVENPMEILKNSMNETTKPYYGFAIKPFHFDIANFSAMEFLNQSFLLNFTYFILIRRKNLFRGIVSAKISEKTDVWHSCREDIANLKTIHLLLNKPKPLVERIDNLERRMQEVETLLVGKKVLNLTYEDDIEQDPQKAYYSICKFVNMEPIKASINFSKTNPFPLKDVIENFAEVKATLHKTPYEWMLLLVPY